MRTVVLISLILLAISLQSQEIATVHGLITDEKGKGIELVNVAVSGLPGGTMTDRKGKFELEVPANKEIYISISFIGLEKGVEKVFLKPGEVFELNKVLKAVYTELPPVEVEDKQIRSTTMTRIDPKVAVIVPTSSDKIPTLLKTLPGVSSNNELSSQYSVRGGNYDENLVYVNDIEIYRPYLIRSGQQEGLSFINSDLVSSLLFSAGGFEAKYGDKMSSVLDLQYKKPTEFGGSASVSLLGASVHAEGTLANKKVSYLTGIRYKTNQYLLNALETKGDYKPSFLDVQLLTSWDISKKVEISFLGNIADNNYRLIPETRETDFGTYKEAYRLVIYFDGQEIDRFRTWLGGTTVTYKPDNKTRLKLIASKFNSMESESFDILGQYWIGRIETNYGSENYGDVIETQGVGSNLNHARNTMDINVFNLAHKGTREYANNLLQWGIKYQNERVDDEMNEWIMIDSAGYSIPRPPDSLGYVDPGAQTNFPFTVYELIRTSTYLNTDRFTAYLQNTWGTDTELSRLSFSAGIRASYWTHNGQVLVSPRASASYKPDWKRDFLFRLSGGLYYQPPFYRELKDISGSLNNDQKAQTSAHIVAGSDYNFRAWRRPFKFVTEIYYKYLDNMIPYFTDNVRIRYYAFQKSHGYAAGIDMKVNGEFVKGIESWMSLSFMNTVEDIYGDYYLDSSGNPDYSQPGPGYIPRPSDQTVNVGLFFQDYLPRNPTYKMSLTMLFGSSLPFGPPHAPKYLDTLRMMPYWRVDIGFSKEIIGDFTRFSSKSPFRVFESLWLTAEVLNLLQRRNTVSYTWVEDIAGKQWAVPNYLTPRQLNVKLIATF
ncbi:MAG: TonB-dependent receptor [Bacteroidetes bacterium]|nr:TonB-dependent receptor [Bacteroidota bacterium]